jgi:hypothetical protein
VTDLSQNQKKRSEQIRTAEADITSTLALDKSDLTLIESQNLSFVK